MRRLFFALALLAVVLAPVPADAQVSEEEDCTSLGHVPDSSEAPPWPFWKTDFIFDEVRPGSVTTEGLNLYFLDHGDSAMSRPPRIVRLPLNKPTIDTCALPTPWDEPGFADRALSVLLLGPRAFYLVATTVDDAVPTLFRANRFPTAIRGGWRALRQIGGPAEEGLAAVTQDSTLFMLRSVPEFEVDWQPIESTFAEQSIPPVGATINLSPFASRPAAGVTVTRDSIYVFGGRTAPNDATRIPLVRRSPQTPDALPGMPNGRQGATALVHSSFVYLVGGNDPGKPTIERHRLPYPTNAAEVAWQKLPEPPPDGGAVLTSIISRGKLWLVREDGQIQSMPIDAAAPGRATVNWDRSVRRQRLVRKGDGFVVDIPWSYSGPLELRDVSLEVKASPYLTDSRREVFAGHLNNYSSLVLPASPPEAPFQVPDPIRLNVNIPLDRTATSKARQEYVATIQVRTGRSVTQSSCTQTNGIPPCIQRIGQPITLRFTVDNRPTPVVPPTPTP